MPRLVPPAITTTEPAACLAAATAVAVAAPENRSKSSPSAWCTVRTPYAASWAAAPSGHGPTRTASIGTPPPAAASLRANVTVSRETSLTPSAVVSDVDQDHRPTPSFCSRSTTAPAASGPSPSTSTVEGAGGGRRQPHPAAARRVARRPAGSRSRSSWPSSGPVIVG